MKKSPHIYRNLVCSIITDFYDSIKDQKHRMSSASWCSVCFCVVLFYCFCKGHFVTVPLNLTYLHCLQHSLFEHLFNLYQLINIDKYIHVINIQTNYRKYIYGTMYLDVKKQFKVNSKLLIRFILTSLYRLCVK